MQSWSSKAPEAGLLWFTAVWTRACQAFCLIALFCLGWNSALAAERNGRVALVIGNGAYSSSTALVNPPNDARDVGLLLKNLEFEVVEAIDLDRRGFAEALAKFFDRASRAEAALFYYAGHGIQLGEDNYLLPIDAKPDSVFALKADSFSLKSVLGELEAVSPVNLVFLDACRDNPLSQNLSRSLATRGGSPLGRGLARVDPTGSNTMIAFAAAPGAVALDGTGRNSPFTSAFIKAVRTNKDEVSTLFKEIVRDVLAATDGAQRPQLVSSMSVNFFFNSTVSVAMAPAPTPDAAQAAFDSAARIDTAASYQAVIDAYPNSFHAKLAAAAAEKLAATERQKTAALVKPATPEKVPAAAAPAETQVATLSPAEIEADLDLTRKARRDIQRALIDLGYNAGTTESLFNSRTREAIKQYQTAIAAPGTGYVSPRLLAALGIPHELPAPPQPRDARRYTLADLGSNPEPRLAKAVAALADAELRYGYFNGHLYVAVLNWSVNWDSAKQLSKAAGGHLVTITSKAEHDFAFELFATDDRFVSLHQDFYLDGPWIGLYQEKGAREPAGGWKWVTGEPLDFRRWHPGTPDNYSRDDAGRFWGATNEGREKRAIWWNDAPAHAAMRGFIMEVEPLAAVASLAAGVSAAKLPPQGAEARRIAAADIPLGAEPRLRKAVEALSKHELAYGYFRGNLYITVLSWGADWQSARRLAEAAGGHLVTISDAAENKFVRDLYVKDARFEELNEEGNSYLGPHIGLFQAEGGKEPAGGWQWVTGEPLKFKAWSASEPNNFNGDERFATFIRHVKGGGSPVWNDTNSAKGFIMEVEPLPGAPQPG